jgi:hypothetical protein
MFAAMKLHPIQRLRCAVLYSALVPAMNAIQKRRSSLLLRMAELAPVSLQAPTPQCRQWGVSKPAQAVPHLTMVKQAGSGDSRLAPLGGGSTEGLSTQMGESRQGQHLAGTHGLSDPGCGAKCTHLDTLSGPEPSLASTQKISITYKLPEERVEEASVMAELQALLAKER